MIFEDPSHRRWRRALLVFSLLMVAAAAALGVSIASMVVPPEVPNPFSARSQVRATLVRASLTHDLGPIYTEAQKRRMKAIRAQERRRRNKLVGDAKGAPILLPENAVVAYTMQDDAASVASLERHVANIDIVVPDWFELPGPGCDLIERVDDKTRRVLGRSDVLVLPRISNLIGTDWHAAETSKFLVNDAARACLEKRLVQRLVDLGAAGLNLDLGELRPEDSDPFLKLIVELRTALHARSLRLTVNVPFHNPAFDLEYIGNVADAVMVMGYDQHYPSSEPGPIAARAWLQASYDEVLPRLPAERVVIVLGNYGYDWQLSDDEDPPPAEDLSFRGAMDLARAADAQPTFDEQIENGHFGYRDPDGKNHEVWFEDALATWNQRMTLRQRGISRIGLWRLGTEDESLWTFFGADTPPPTPDVLASIAPGKSVGLFGEGEVFTIRNEPQAGVRQIVKDPQNSIIRATYTKVPSGYVVERLGGNGRLIALTFDDGPDERNTGHLLDALRALHAPATFFVVGDQAMRFPDLVERASDEGHLIGNHSFTHPRMETLTPREAAGQLAATERLVEGLTGLRTPLFRAPYVAEVDPDRPEDLTALRVALQNGYLFVGANVDPDDWKATDVNSIVRVVIDEIVEGRGRIVVLHDGGGDRSRTIAAVKKIVPELRRRGYEIASLDKLLEVKRSQLAMPIPAGERVLSASDAFMAYARGWGWTTLAVLFFVCTVLSIIRISFLGALTLKNLKLPAPEPPKEFAPLVSVIVPAYNEAKVIATTLRSLLASEHQNLEIIVVDDGSTDETSNVVAALAQAHPQIKLFRQENAGKAAAANHAIRVAQGEIVVAVDADTVVPPSSIPKMIRHFALPEVTAVCGNVEVGNVHGLLTTFQAIEYVTSQNFDRRAFSVLNCISVVPGALGAWRRGAMIDAGGYSEQTLTEDADLTLTILQRGGRVVYEPEAHACTEAPESLGALLRQRFRWTYGTYQCLWKHKPAFFHGTLGWIGLPNMVVFQLIFPMLSPIGDIVMLLSIWRGDWRAFVAGYFVFLAMDICGSLLAFTLDHKPWRWLTLLLIQRFSYRQIMYYVCFKAMLAALRGARHGWRKLDRTGSVSGKHGEAALGLAGAPTVAAAGQAVEERRSGPASVAPPP